MKGAYADAVSAEWIKARSLASTGWLLAAIIGSGVGLSAAICAVTHGTGGALSGLQLAQAPVAVWGGQGVNSEYRSGLISVTIAAVPRRTVVLAAKTTVIGALTLAAGLLAVAGCLVAARLEQSPAPDLIAVPAAALTLCLISLLSLGTALAARGSAAAIGIVLSLLYLFPLTAQLTGDPTWHRRLLHLGPSAGLPALAGWAAASLLVGGLIFQRRDA